MIIECINCHKRFKVNSELIPEEGRNIQCGSCNHVWFFTKNNQNDLPKSQIINDEKSTILKQRDPKKEKKTSQKINQKKIFKKNQDYSQNKKQSALIKYEKDSNFSFTSFLSLILVLIISFIGLIIILDTFKSPLYNLFPNLEFVLFSLFETIKDIGLFIKDLI